MASDISWQSFIAASLLILLIPGPGVMYVISRSLTQGPLASVVSALGLSAGVLVHVLAAVVGLSALLLSSATAFTIVKYIGAAYLVYLGLQAFRTATRTDTLPASTSQPWHRLFIDGVIVSVFNPKIALFFLAFLPQFVRPEVGSITQQVVSLGVLYAVLALMTDSTYGLIAGWLIKTLDRRCIRGPVLHYLAGSAMIGLGLKTALITERP